MKKKLLLFIIIILLFLVSGCVRSQSKEKYENALEILTKYPESLYDSSHPKANEVIDLLNEARLKDPPWWKPYMKLLYCYQSQKQYGDIINVYQLWIKENGNRLTNQQHLGLGAAYELNGELIKAQEYFFQAWCNLEETQIQKKKITESELVAGVYAGFLSGLLTVERYPVYTDWFGGKTSLYEFVIYYWKYSQREEILNNFVGY